MEDFGQPEEEQTSRDYWVVAGSFGQWFMVTQETAVAIQRRLQRRRPPRWIRFPSLFGEDICLRSDQVKYVAQSTREQRAAARAFDRALQKEESADRPSWEDDDDW